MNYKSTFVKLFFTLIFCLAFSNAAFAQEANVNQQCVINPFAEGEFALGFWFYDDNGDRLPTHYYNFDESLGFLTQYDNGTATYTGTIVSIDDPNDSWEFTMNFINGSTWDEWEALGRNYKIKGEGCTGDEYLYTTYYEIDGVTSLMTGTGTNAGYIYNITHYPVDMSYGAQVGYGGHNSAPNCEYSIGAWFGLELNGEALGKGDIHSILNNCITRPCSAIGDADDDSDDVCNVFDRCADGDDNIDLNCDGTPDACDNAQIVDQCALLPFDPDTTSFVLGFYFDPDSDEKNWLLYNFNEEGGFFTQYDDGTANYQGLIINDENPEDSWFFCMNFENKMDWEAWSALGRDYKIRGEGCTDSTHLTLEYYEIGSNSFMTGLGINEGLEYEIGHFPIDYNYGAQLGEGGHNSAPNCEYSIGAWFNIYDDGELVGKGDIHSILNCAVSFPLPVSVAALLQGPAVEEPAPQLKTGNGDKIGTDDPAYKAADEMVWMMNDDLRSENLIPLDQPFTNLPNFNHNGIERVSQDVLDNEGINAVIDWVLIEIRDPNAPQEILRTQAALIQRDGDVVNTDGVSPVKIDAKPGKYHIALKHRNHLGVMTAEAVQLDALGIANIDFTSPETLCYGENACATLGDVKALWSGSIKGDGQIIFQGTANGVNEIFFDVLTHPENTEAQINFIINEYTNSDADMNCQTIYQGINNDPNAIFFNVLMHPGNVNFSTNYIIKQQIPE